MAVNTTDIDAETRRVCEGHQYGRHAVPHENRLGIQPWTCSRCNKPVVDDDYTGRFMTDQYIVVEEPDPLELPT